MNTEQFYRNYIARSEEMKIAIQRKDWANVDQYVQWREEHLTQMKEAIEHNDVTADIHKEWLNKIMVLECENIFSLTKMTELLKHSIQESRKQERLLQYTYNA